MKRQLILENGLIMCHFPALLLFFLVDKLDVIPAWSTPIQPIHRFFAGTDRSCQ